MESTLSLKMADLKTEIGSFLGWGGGVDYGDEAWTADKERRLSSLLGSALRMVYVSPLTADGKVHNWSFLQPVAEITMLTGAQEAVLPDDFGGIEGTVTVSLDGQAGYWPIKIDNAEIIRQRYAAFPNATGRPYTAALEAVKDSGPQSGSRMKMTIYPASDAAYTLRFGYYILPDMLTAAAPYPYGGMAHAETFKAACRAAAEMFQDNARGVEWMNFERCLAASILYDRKNKAQTLGYNGDASDGMARNWGRNMPWWAYGGQYGSTIVTIDGITPS